MEESLKALDPITGRLEKRTLVTPRGSFCLRGQKSSIADAAAPQVLVANPSVTSPRAMAWGSPRGADRGSVAADFKRKRLRKYRWSRKFTAKRSRAKRRRHVVCKNEPFGTNKHCCEDASPSDKVAP
jgi:hypothetical protein